MSDIVKRLRNNKADTLGNLILRNEAADEIERLTEDLAYFQEVHRQAGTEIERLRGAGQRLST